MTVIPDTTKNAKAYCLACGTELTFHMAVDIYDPMYECLGCGGRFNNLEEVNRVVDCHDGCLLVTEDEHLGKWQKKNEIQAEEDRFVFFFADLLASCPDGCLAVYEDEHL
jgi:hypothetical protein